MTVALRLSGLAVAAAILLPQVALALINPKYTVVDLMRDCGEVLVLRVSAPQDGKVTGEVVEAIVGTVPAGKKYVFDFSKAEDLAEEKVVGAFAGAKTGTAVMCVQKKKQEDKVVGALEIGTTWMGLAQVDGKGAWNLDKDPNDLETVWGGSARKLIPAIRYTLTDPSAVFPVASAMEWGKDMSIAELRDAVHGCLVTGVGAIILSDGGDRVYEPGAKGASPVDVTAKLGLATKSKAMVAGDLNGDGRCDLASWDGTAVTIHLRGADGKFVAQPGGYGLVECRSLGILDGALVVGGATGVVLLKPDGKGGFAARRLDAGADLGPGGVCEVADFNGDGTPDIVQVFAKGLIFHAGDRNGGFASSVVTKVQVVKVPTGIVCGDFDTDGQLDMVVTGAGGSALLSREDGGAWSAITEETGELGAASGLGQGDTTVVAACPSDLNGDGRQSVAMFNAAGSPGLFFNRGFACFGVARTLGLSEVKSPAADALGAGQITGTLTDLNGDLVPDMLAVDQQRMAWAVFGDAKSPRRFHLTLSTPGSAKSPLTVTVSLGQREIGMWVVKPGERTAVGLPRAGKVTVAWKAVDGTAVSREVTVATPKTLELQ